MISFLIELQMSEIDWSFQTSYRKRSRIVDMPGSESLSGLLTII